VSHKVIYNNSITFTKSFTFVNITDIMIMDGQYILKGTNALQRGLGTLQKGLLNSGASPRAPPQQASRSI